MALGKTVRQLETELDSRELSEWICYSHLDPWDGWRGDLQAGIVASTLANIHRKKGAKPLKPQDFMLDFGKKEKSKQTPEQIKAAMMGLVHATAKTKKRR